MISILNVFPFLRRLVFCSISFSLAACAVSEALPSYAQSYPKHYQPESKHNRYVRIIIDDIIDELFLHACILPSPWPHPWLLRRSNWTGRGMPELNLLSYYTFHPRELVGQCNSDCKVATQINLRSWLLCKRWRWKYDAWGGYGGEEEELVWRHESEAANGGGHEWKHLAWAGLFGLDCLVYLFLLESTWNGNFDC